MSNFNPLVSIILPVYNGSNYMREAIDSALAQTYKNIEIIVVNDGSTDNTEEIALSYGNKIKYFSKENGGVATALNLAIEKAQGEYISWLSHDDLYLPNKIERQIEELNKLEDKNTILYTDYYLINSSSKHLRTFIDSGSSENMLFRLIKYYPLNGCTLLIPKLCFIKGGFFREDLPATQDYEMWFRLCKVFPIKYISMFSVKSRLHMNQGSRSQSSQHYKECNNLYKNFLEDKEIVQANPNYFDFSLHLLKKGFNEAADYSLDKAFGEPQVNYIFLIIYYKILKLFYNIARCIKQVIKSILLEG